MCDSTMISHIPGCEVDAYDSTMISHTLGWVCVTGSIPLRCCLQENKTKLEANSLLVCATDTPLQAVWSIYLSSHVWTLQVCEQENIILLLLDILQWRLKFITRNETEKYCPDQVIMTTETEQTLNYASSLHGDSKYNIHTSYENVTRGVAKRGWGDSPGQYSSPLPYPFLLWGWAFVVFGGGGEQHLLCWGAGL